MKAFAYFLAGRGDERSTAYEKRCEAIRISAYFKTVRGRARLQNTLD